MKRTCKQCGKDFFLSKSEIDFYNKKKLSLPRRCKECREANKNNGSSSATDGNKNNIYTSNASSAGASVNKKNYKSQAESIDYTPLGNDNYRLPFPKCMFVFGLVIIIIVFLLIGFLSKNSEAVTLESSTEVEQVSVTEYHFRNKKLLNEHFEKHGREMGFSSAKEYENAASNVINNPAALTKTEAEDGDYVYYVEASNEFVILSTDGYIRTYYLPNKGKAYFDRQ